MPTQPIIKSKALSVAPKIPNTRIAVVGGWKFAPNVAALGVWSHEGSYLVGYMAAAMSKTGKVGYVAGFKYPTQVADRNGYLAGI